MTKGAITLKDGRVEQRAPAVVNALFQLTGKALSHAAAQHAVT